MVGGRLQVIFSWKQWKGVSWRFLVMEHWNLAYGNIFKLGSTVWLTGFSVPQPVIKPRPLAVRVQGPNH